MANWTALKAAIAAVIKTNGNKEITGAVLQSTLNTIVSNLGENAAFKGMATPTTAPGTPDGNLFYLATQKGSYSNFGGVTITNNDGLVLLLYSGTWSKINIPVGLKDDILSTDFYLSGNNNSYLDSFIVTDSKITIQNNGFSIIRKRDNKIMGYVGYVAGEDTSTTFDLIPDAGVRTLYVIDTSVLIPSSRTSFSQSIKKFTDVIDGSITYPYIPLVSFYLSKIVPFGLLSSLVSTYLLSTQNQRQLSYNLRYNINVDGMRIDGMKIYIKPSGFGVFYNSKIYYIADATNSRVNDYEFDLTPIGVTYAYLVLDESKLILENVRNELSGVIKIVQGDLIKSTSIILAVSDAQTGKVRFVGQFADYFAKYATKEYVDSVSINNSTMNLKTFEPEFYAYKRGRINDINGVGTGWYERFRMIHISDTHQYNTLVLEAIKMAQTKVHVIANTGDDGNGSVSTPTETSISWMQNVASIIAPNNTLPYIAVKGNHDICNITKAQWRDNIGNIIQQNANIQWGSLTGAYGYYDIMPNANIGTFRIIMLDPFDYSDSDFPNVRAFQTATFSQDQINWLISSLIDAANNNIHVITMMHYSFGDNSLNFNDDKAKPDALFYQDAFMIPDIIDAIQNKSILNKIYNDSVGTQNITINQDFSSVGDLDFVCHLFGHIHSKNDYWCQKTDGSKLYDILMLGESALGTYGNALNKVYRETGTINEIEFSALEIDTIEKMIYRVSYGAYLKYDKTNNIADRTKKISYRKI